MERDDKNFGVINCLLVVEGNFENISNWKGAINQVLHY